MGIQRWLQPVVRQALESRRVIIIAGPRQCGVNFTREMALYNFHFRPYRTNMEEV